MAGSYDMQHHNHHYQCHRHHNFHHDHDHDNHHEPQHWNNHHYLGGWSHGGGHEVQQQEVRGESWVSTGLGVCAFLNVSIFEAFILIEDSSALKVY